jgi:hypothetical protein
MLQALFAWAQAVSRRLPLGRARALQLLLPQSTVRCRDGSRQPMPTTANVSCFASTRYKLRLRQTRSKYFANQWLSDSEHDCRWQRLPSLHC